jgi:hypothetical protein
MKSTILLLDAVGPKLGVFEQLLFWLSAGVI